MCLLNTNRVSVNSDKVATLVCCYWKSQYVYIYINMHRAYCVVFFCGHMTYFYCINVVIYPYAVRLPLSLRSAGDVNTDIDYWTNNKLRRNTTHLEPCAYHLGYTAYIQIISRQILWGLHNLNEHEAERMRIGWNEIWPGCCTRYMIQCCPVCTRSFSLNCRKKYPQLADEWQLFDVSQFRIWNAFIHHDIFVWFNTILSSIGPYFNAVRPQQSVNIKGDHKINALYQN